MIKSVVFKADKAFRALVRIVFRIDQFLCLLEDEWKCLSAKFKVVRIEVE